MAGLEKQRLYGTAEAVRQFVEGNDFEPPERMIADLSPENATIVPNGSPYSIAGQVGHMLFWQKRWLGRIRDEPLGPKEGKNIDWPPISPDMWDSVRDEFIKGLEMTRAISNHPDEFLREVSNGNTVDQILLMIVEHNAYHLGQIALLRQLIGAWPPAGGDDEW
jgi:uncharacterized damage-inducible protein DinB